MENLNQSLQKNIFAIFVQPQQPLTILAIDTDGVDGDAENRMLGTDFMFLTAFLGKITFYEIELVNNHN